MGGYEKTDLIRHDLHCPNLKIVFGSNVKKQFPATYTNVAFDAGTFVGQTT
jgi:hypothetical protein